MPAAPPSPLASSDTPLTLHLRRLFDLNQMGVRCWSPVPHLRRLFDLNHEWDDKRRRDAAHYSGEQALADWHRQMCTAMALAGEGPFDPHGLIEMKVSPDRATWIPMTALEAVLQADWTDTLQEPAATPRAAAEWPDDPASFGKDLLARVGGPIDGEWVAAWFTAAGCDPWRIPVHALDAWWNAPRRRGRPLPPIPVSAVERAMHHGYVGLLDRFFRLPGAPGDLQAWVDGWSWQRWNLVLERQRAFPTLQWLLRRGVRWRGERGLLQLARAHPRAVEALVQAQACDITPGRSKRLSKRWNDWWKDEFPNAATRRQVADVYAGALAGEPGARTVGMALSQVLRQAWGEPCPIERPASDAWGERYRLRVGPMAGHWNGAGVWALGQLKAWGHGATSALPLAGDEADAYRAACQDTWRAGFPWSGLVWLAALNRRLLHPPPGDVKQSDVTTIPHPQAAVRAAVAFSGALVGNTALQRNWNVADLLRALWGHAVATLPQVGAALGDRERAALLEGLALPKWLEEYESTKG